jgi:cell volume regulation protein A
MAKKLHLTMPPEEHKKLVHFDIDLPEEVESVAIEMEVTNDMITNGTCLKDIKFDTKLLVIMVRRGEDFFVPTGLSELEIGDQLLIISDSAAEATEQYIEDVAAEENEHWGMLLINNTWQFAKQKWQQIINPKKPQ